MRFHHYALETSDFDRAKAFYTNVFGFKVEGKIFFEEEEIYFLALENFRLELLRKKEGDNKNCNNHLCFEVTNLTEFMKHLKNREIAIEEGTYELENGWRGVFIYGPDMEIIELLQVD